MKTHYNIISKLIILLINLFIITGNYAQTNEIKRLPGGRVGNTYNMTIPARGGIQPYTFKMANGELPPGLELNEQGELNGTFEKPGSYQFTVEVKDKSNQVDSREVLIVVEPLMTNLQKLEIKTDSLPIAIKNKPYYVALSAEGGMPPYTWGINEELPEGLKLDSTGIINGIPKKEGISELTLKVKDYQSNYSEASVICKMEIKPLEKGFQLWWIILVIVFVIIIILLVSRSKNKRLKKEMDRLKNQINGKGDNIDRPKGPKKMHYVDCNSDHIFVQSLGVKVSSIQISTNPEYKKWCSGLNGENDGITFIINTGGNNNYILARNVAGIYGINKVFIDIRG